jgi:CheY-like chemotaxis protein
MDPLPSHAAVFVIEGDEILRATIADILAVDGYHVRSAWSAEEGWAQLMAEPVDLIICNAELPDLSGYAFVVRLQDYPLYRAIPAIIISTAPEPHFATRPYRAFLAMPFDVDDLLQLVARLLGESQR